MRKSLSVLFIFALIVGCTPKETESFGSASPNSDSKKIGILTNGMGSLTANKSTLRGDVNNIFKDVSKIADFKVISNNQSDYYLVSTGELENTKVSIAIELTLKGKDLYLEKYNSIRHMCKFDYCDACAYKFNNRGAIDGCLCGEGEQDRKEGQPACGHTMNIQSIER